MIGDVPSAPTLKDEHKLIIATWLRPHTEWIDSTFTALS
jgi:hypothetical protein